VLIAVGVATIFLFHVFVNVGMTMGIMPVTGIPLPFISYGRSSLVVSIVSLGLLQSIAMRSRSEASKHPKV
jgi:rod shape determining protein RodA